MTIRTLLSSLRFLYHHDVSERFKLVADNHAENFAAIRNLQNRVADVEINTIIHSRNIETLLNRANGDEIDALTVRLENLRDEALSIVNKHRTLIAYLVKDVEDLKNAKPGEEPRRTETPITISINVDGVPVRPEVKRA
jgi:intracellular sulfur oxidation DsrE/DsrF family protein